MMSWEDYSLQQVAQITHIAYGVHWFTDSVTFNPLRTIESSLFCKKFPLFESFFTNYCINALCQVVALLLSLWVFHAYTGAHQVENVYKNELQPVSTDFLAPECMSLVVSVNTS